MPCAATSCLTVKQKKWQQGYRKASSSGEAMGLRHMAQSIQSVAGGVATTKDQMWRGSELELMLAPTQCDWVEKLSVAGLLQTERERERKSRKKPFLQSPDRGLTIF